MLTQAMDDAAWDARIAQLGQVVDLEASARSHAERCGGGDRSARQQSCCGCALAVSCWGACRCARFRPGLRPKGGRRCRMSPSSTGCGPAPTGWARIAAALLAERYPEAVTDTGARLIAWTLVVVVDATTVVPPGDKRDYWLVHTVFRSHRSALSGGGGHRAQRAGASRSWWRAAGRGAHRRPRSCPCRRSGRGGRGRGRLPVRAAANYPRLVDQTGHPLDRLPCAGRRRGRGRPTSRWW